MVWFLPQKLKSETENLRKIFDSVLKTHGFNVNG